MLPSLLRSSKIILLFLLPLFSCIPDHIENDANKAIKQAMYGFADNEFQSLIGSIELHKLRNGKYPDSISELKYVNYSDSSSGGNIKYINLGEQYELYLYYPIPNMTGSVIDTVDLKYPNDFWKGLGCVKSNAMTH